MARILVVLLALLPLCAQAITIKGIRTWAGPDETRVVFDLSDAATHSVFTLENPGRVVIDFDDTRIDPVLAGRIEAAGLLKGLRSGVREGKNLRVVLDLAADAKAQSFLVRPSGQYGHRLVVDLKPVSSAAPAPVKSIAGSGPRPLVIAIDAGHGGDDPGAIGPRGTYEKDVVLAVAKKLAYLIDKEPGFEAQLIRSGDYYVGLRARREKARARRADMFVSIHADAVGTRRVQGASVYTLSRRGASTETARLLAERENSADLIGGVSLENKDDMVATVLLDLSRAATTESSLSLAGSILQRLDGVGKLHKTQVEQAGFAVLKSLDMPSVLVELAFISNPAEERRLKSSEYQWQLARAILAGIRDYREEHAPQSARLAAAAPREHVVRSGDTLSAIASRYQVSLDTLRNANALAGDTIRVGHTLVIPQ